MRKQGIDSLRRREKGQALTEYAVLVSLVAVASIAAMALFGAALKGRVSALVAAIAGESTEKIEEGEASARAASEQLRQRLKKVSGMKVDSGSSGEVIDEIDLGKK